MRAVLLVVCAVCMAQQAEPPVFRTTTRLVEFTVVAQDAKGRAVTDLTKDEIEVEERGKARPVAFFRFEGGREQRAGKAPAPGVYSNRVEAAAGPARNVTALVLDSLNTLPEQMMYVRWRMVEYLKALAPESRVAIYHLGAELKVLHDFTDDHEALRARVAKLAVELPRQSISDVNAMLQEAERMREVFGGNPVLEEMLASAAELEAMHNAVIRESRAQRTLAALDALGAHLEGIKGRKNLVWIGGGISMLAINGRMGFGPHGGWKSIEKDVVASAQRLAQRGVALYAVDSRGLVAPQASGASLQKRRPAGDLFEGVAMAAEMSADPLPAAHRLAEITGGRVIKDTNDPAEGIDRAVEDLRGAYSVAFYVEDEPDGKWHALKVKTKRQGIRLTYRQGFVAEDPERRVAWGGAEWRAAATDPLGASGIGLEAKCVAEAGTVKLDVKIEPEHLQYRKVEGKDVAEVEVLVAEKTALGAAALHLEAGRIGAEPEAARYVRTWRPGPEATAVRVVVRDRVTGRYGTLDVPLKQR